MPAELRIPGLGTMPRRTEEEGEAGEEAEWEEEEEDSFLPLDQPKSLSVSGEVDQLASQIGETLQLDTAQDSPASPCVPPGPPLQPVRPPLLPLLLPPAPTETVGPTTPGALRCALGERGRVRGRAAPYFVAELTAGPSALSPLSPRSSLDGPSGDDERGAPKQLSGPCRREWLRGATTSRRRQQRRGPQAEVRTVDEDPHRLLQQLLLSGNLIKEAVRRLHSQRLQLHSKLPQHRLRRPVTAAGPKPPSPRSPGMAGSNPGAKEGRVPLETGGEHSCAWQLIPRSSHSASLCLEDKGFPRGLHLYSDW